jgi:hypothetical protein
MTMTNGEAREALRSAQGNLAAAEAALTAARSTTGRAREILSDAIREGEKFDAQMRQASDVLADKIRGAIEAGSSPAIPAGDMTKNAAARAAIDLRRTAAARVVSDFSAAEHEAAAVLEEARGAVAGAIKGVLRSEAEAMAARWAAVDAEARVLRSRLGRAYGPISQLGALDDDVSRAIGANNDDAVNLEETAAVAAVWNALAADLAQNSDARLDFGPVDRARESARADRDRVHVSTAEIIARMRSPMLAVPPEDSWIDRAMADREYAEAGA